MKIELDFDKPTMQRLQALAKSRDQTVDALLKELTIAHILRADEIQTFFRDRAKTADLNWLDTFLSREGGQPPVPEDRVE